MIAHAANSIGSETVCRGGRLRAMFGRAQRVEQQPFGEDRRQPALVVLRNCDAGPVRHVRQQIPRVETNADCHRAEQRGEST